MLLDSIKKLSSQNKLSDKQISEKLNIPIGRIFRLRKKHNIPSVKYYEKQKLNNLSLEQKQIIIGMILGDGHIRKRGKENCYPQIMVEQSVNHKNYVLWIKEKFKNLLFNPNKDIKVNKKINKKNNKIYNSLSFQTICHPVFCEFYNSFYLNSKKIIDFELLNKYFNELSLAVWIMDDGGLTGRTKRNSIATNNFSLEEVIKLKEFLEKKYNLKSWIITRKTKTSIGYEIHFDKNSSLKITELVQNLIVPSMRYKLLKETKEIDISEKEWEQLNKNHTKEEIKQIISDKIKSSPLPLNKINVEEAEKDFELLRQLDINKLLKTGEWFSRYTYKYNFENKYLDICKIGNKSSNHFQQYNRFNCDSITSPSVKRIWETEKFRLTMLNALWSLKCKKVNTDTLRSVISVRKYIPSQFKPSVAKWVYEKYGNGGDVLDFSSGWGDRLSGFYASNCKSYVGIDPNIDVYNNYKHQIKLYEKYINKNVEIINSPAEDVILDRFFDLVFTSPPYFDLERYSQEKTQSWKKYKKLDDWLSNFLFKSIGNFWKNLKSGGYLIINISDVYSHHERQHICDPMNDFISNLNNSSYMGALGMRMSKRPNNKLTNEGIFAEPLWIWKKTI